MNITSTAVTLAPHSRTLFDRGYSCLSKHETLCAVLIFIAVLHIAFFPFIWGNQTLLAGSRGVASVMTDGAAYGPPEGPAIYRGNDMGASAWVLEAYAPLVRHQYFGEKRVPLWNPYQAYGMPLAADMQSQAFNPLFILFSLHPSPRTYNFFIFSRFLIAGLFTYLYLRLFLSFAASVAGGIACMLSGYYILFYNMTHISVDMLVPAVFFVTERLLRQETVRNVLLATIIIFLCIIGGMPESTLLALSFGYAYFLYRVLSDPPLRAGALRHLAYFSFVNAVGFALAAVLLIPFGEFMRISFDMHQPSNLGGTITGNRHDLLGPSIFTYLVPGLFGPPAKTVSPGLGGYYSLRGFFGILQFLFAVVAVGGLIQKKARRLRGQRAITLFFLLSVIALVLKRYGSPIVNWIGYLPLYNLTWFPKYEHSLLAFAFAVLCGVGVNDIFTQTAHRRRLIVSLLVSFVALLGIGAASIRTIFATGVPANMYYLSIGGALGILFLASIVLLGFHESSHVASASAAAMLIALLVVEMTGDYILPVYYVLSHAATDDANPYRGARYLTFLKSRMTPDDRVVGRNGVLHPNWASTFRIGDIRALDAMYYRKYLTFVQAFLLRGKPLDMALDLGDRFTGVGTYNYDQPLNKRLLQLSSVKYLLSLWPYAPDSAFIQDIIRQNAGRFTPGREKLVEVRAFNIRGETKPVLFEHPTYERLPLTTVVTGATRQFLFSIAMDPVVYDGSYPLCGDGVEFRLELRDGKGRVEPLYDRYIDPKNDPTERKWFTESIDLRRYMGQRIELLFTTTPGPAGNSCMDWAGWGDPHFSGEAEAKAAFRPVYDHEIKIYQYDDILPRAALFSHVEFAADESAALARVTAQSFDVFQTAVVSPSDLNPQEIAAVKSMNSVPPERVQPARIVSYASQEVKIDASPRRPSLLVLNDSDYPGWKVYVDGKRSHWVTANYLFRGVLLSAGKHTVRFAYEPTSFAAGAGISGLGFICLAVFVAWKRNESKRAAHA